VRQRFGRHTPHKRLQAASRAEHDERGGEDEGEGFVPDLAVEVHAVPEGAALGVEDEEGGGVGVGGGEEGVVDSVAEFGGEGEEGEGGELVGAGAAGCGGHVCVFCMLGLFVGGFGGEFPFQFEVWFLED